MPCYHPLSAWQTAGGEVVWVERGDIVRSLFLPCGQCIGCRLERSRQWAIRIMHETQLYEENCFVTLTYDDDNVAKDRSLCYCDFQRFMKRLRKRWKVRFFCAGEYGDEDKRPHFHAAIFGYAFRKDRKRWKKSGGGFYVDRSAELEALWRYGFSSVGDLSFESAAYIARYVTKKVNESDKSSPEALALWKAKYERLDEETGELTWLVPEFCHMSLKPGIGADWFKKFGKEVFPLDRVVARGVPCKPPKFYDGLYSRVGGGGALEEVKEARILRAVERGDNSEERLAVKEQVAVARLKFYRRSL